MVFVRCVYEDCVGCWVGIHLELERGVVHIVVVVKDLCLDPVDLVNPKGVESRSHEKFISCT